MPACVRHAEWRIEALREHAPGLGDPVPIGITQQRNPVGAWHAGARNLHEELHRLVLQATLSRLWGCIGLRDEHVAVWQYVQ